MKAINVDENFTAQYIQELYDLVNKLIRFGMDYPIGNQTWVQAVAHLHGDLKPLILAINRNRTRSVNKELALHPNILIEFDNPDAPSGHKFYMSLGAKIQIEECVLVDQSISLNIIVSPDQDLTAQDAEQAFCSPFKRGYHVLRKFHFDLDMGIRCGTRPISHFQYGGGRPNYLPFEDFNYELYAPLDIPRFPSIPSSLIVFLDQFIKLLSRNPLHDITKENYWKNAVLASEKLWLEPFFKSAYEHLSKADRKETLFDFFCQPASH